MHSVKHPGEAEFRHPLPYRVGVGEIDRGDHHEHPAYEVPQWHVTDPAESGRHAAIGRIVAIVAHHEDIALRHDVHRRVVVRAIPALLVDGMLDAARQGLDVLLHREVFAGADFIGAVFVEAASRRPQLQLLPVYRELAVVHLDAIAG
jgi:hypothetical protein